MDSAFVGSLEQTLAAVLSPDNAAIKQATAALKNNFYKDPQALPALIQVLHTNQNDGLKKLAAVEANKLVPKQWEALDGAVQQQIRDSLLPFAFSYPKETVRHSTARLIAEISNLDIPAKRWDGLLGSLVDASTNPDLQTREMATYVLFCVLETFPIEWLSHAQSFMDLFSKTLGDVQSPNVQVNSVLALEVLASFIEEEEDLVATLAGPFSTLFPGMIQVLKNSLGFEDSEKTRELFTAFNSFILLDMQFLGNSFIEILNVMVEVAVNAEADPEIRGFALKTLTQCVSYRKSKIVQAQLGPSLTQAALRIAAEEDDEAEEKLSKEDEENENEEDEPTTLALRLLNTLAVNLPPNQVIQPIMELVPQLLASQDQFQRQTSLLAICVSVEGAPDYMSTQLPKLIEMILTGFQDSAIIVQAAALRTLVQLGEDLKDAVAEYHQSLLQPIINIIDSTDKIMVYKYATQALDTLIEYTSSEAIRAYIEPLMSKLFQMLDSAQSSSLKTAIVSAIGSVAYASGKAFAPYFEHSIQLLEKFIANMDHIDGMTEEDIELRAQTFENISSMARAVGSEAVGSYAEPLMEASYVAINSTNGRLREAGFAFISNMAKVYGDQFTGFLERIVPEILKCVDQEEFDLNLDEDEDGADLDDAALADKLQIHTGISVEKEVALIALADLALGTKAGFAPYVSSCIENLTRQVDESYSIREAALSTMWKIVKAMYLAFGADNATVQHLIAAVRKLSVQLMPDEFDMNMIMTILDCFYEFTKEFGKLAVVDAEDHETLQTLLEQVAMVLKNEHICQSTEQDPDTPEDEDTSELDAVLYDVALEVLVSLSSAFHGDFAAIFENFRADIYAQTNSKSKSKRVSALGCLAEISSNMGSTNPYSQELLELFVSKLTSDKSTEVRGNAAYGVGVVIEHASFDTSAAYTTILSALSELLQRGATIASGDDAEETKEAVNRTYANACGCVSRLALKHEQAVPLGSILPVLFAHLPLQTGFEENTPIFALVMKLMAPGAAGEGSSWLAANKKAVVSWLKVVFEKEAEKDKLLSESTLGREENVERLDQFRGDEKAKVSEFLKWVEAN